ncbi:MAG: hypothetical protein ABIT37_03390 [Luteolibacter sp.]
MSSFSRIRWRNRLIALFPVVNQLSELRYLIQASAGWRTTGWTDPPPYFVKRAVLLAEARAVEARTLVETGTFFGDTTWSFRKSFERIHTIEVQPELAAMARERFRKIPSVTVHEGDSAVLLADLCRTIGTPCVFYLDGHYSGGDTGMGKKECPAIEELDAIFSTMKHAFRIVIDDARLFGTHPAYPHLDEIQSFLISRNTGMTMRVENDAIVIS